MCNKTVPTNLIAEILKHSKIARKKPDGARNRSDRFSNKPQGQPNLFGRENTGEHTQPVCCEHSLQFTGGLL